MHLGNEVFKGLLRKEHRSVIRRFCSKHSVIMVGLRTQGAGLQQALWEEFRDTRDGRPLDFVSMVL